MNEPRFKLGDKVLVKGIIREIIPTCKASAPLYGIRLEDGVVIAQDETSLYFDVDFSNWIERKEQCVEPMKDEMPTHVHQTTYFKSDEFISFVCNKLDELKELFKRKNQQYSVGADPLANFRAGALLRAGNDSYAEMYEEAKNYRRKHVVHIERNGIAANKGDESLDDTIVYSAIMAYMRHCHEQEVAQNE